MWHCSCGQKHEESFDTCWLCGRARGGGSSSRRVGLISDAEEPRSAPDTSAAGFENESETDSEEHESESETNEDEREEADLQDAMVYGRGLTLKEQTILEQWHMMVDRAAENVEEVLDGIQRRLEEAQIPGNCTWTLAEVKSQGWLARTRREFLVIQLEQFGDYRMYVAVRAYGIHLDVCRFTTVEPGFFKRYLSEKLTGSKEFISAPKNILVEQDLSAWATVVHHAVLDAVGTLMDKLGQDRNTIRRESKGILSVW